MDYFVKQNGTTETNGSALSNEDYVNLDAKLRERILEKKRIWHTNWIKRNPEKVREHGRKSYWKHIEKNREECRRYQREHRPQIKERMKQYYIENTERIREKNRILYRMNPKLWCDKRRECSRKQKKVVIFHYSNGTMRCACPGCGCSDIHNLTIDHMNGSGLKHRNAIGSTNIVPWLIRNHFPPGYQVLCFGCNLSKNKSGSCKLKHNKEPN